MAGTFSIKIYTAVLLFLTGSNDGNAFPVPVMGTNYKIFR